MFTRICKASSFVVLATVTVFLVSSRTSGQPLPEPGTEIITKDQKCEEFSCKKLGIVVTEKCSCDFSAAVKTVLWCKGDTGSYCTQPSVFVFSDCFGVCASNPNKDCFVSGIVCKK